MITLITGAPGSGKTLYVVTELLKPLIGTTVWGEDDDGNPKEFERNVHTNINEFVLDHVQIGPEGEGSIRDWFKWGKPGDYICYDEIQKSWKKRPTGSHVPDYIEHLETHRHYGVELCLMTQGTGLIDQNLIPLVGRHLHVRRIGFLPLAIIYEWDHCSRQILFSKAVKKTFWIFKFSGYKLYKSSKLHIKPKTAIPTLAYVVLAALAGAAYFIPGAYNRITGKTDQVKANVAGVDPKTGAPAAAPGATGGPAAPGAHTGTTQARAPGSGGGDPNQGQRYDSTQFIPVVSYEPRSAPAYDHLRQVVAMPRVIGAYCVGEECQCWAQQAVRVLGSKDCWDWVNNRRFDPYMPDRPAPPMPEPDRVAAVATPAGDHQ